MATTIRIAEVAPNDEREEINVPRARRWPSGDELRQEEDLSDEERAAQIRRSEEAVAHAVSQQSDDAPISQKLGALIGELDHLSNIARLKGEPLLETPKEQSAAVFGTMPRIGESLRMLRPDATTPREPLTQQQVNAALEQARVERRGMVEHLMRRPGVDSEADAQRLLRVGDRRALALSLIPAPVRSYLRIDIDSHRLRSVDQAYEKLLDRTADGVLRERAKALRTLHGVDPNTPAHLLSSKQYRAAEVLTRSDARLRELRPLPNDEYRNALASSRPGVKVAASQSESARAAATPTAAPREAEQSRAVLSEREQMDAKRQNAIAAVREIQAGTPVDGYRSKATDSMAAKILAQLNEGRETLNLSARYADTDYAKAKSTHDTAVERNMPLIAAVRGAGISVDTGKAHVANAEKKAEALTPQTEGEKVSV